MNTSKLWFWILLDILVGVVAFTVFFSVMPAVTHFSSSLVSARTISVTSQGKTTATPDLAEISLSVVTQGKSPSDLSTNNNQKMSAVIQFLSSQGIASSDIATTNYDLQPNYQYDANSQRNNIIGYTLTQTVEVKVRDLAKVADVLGGLAPLGVNQIGGVNFTFSDQDSILAIARADALAKAKAKASEMAGEAGASLGNIMNISESGNIPLPMAYYGVQSMAVGSSLPSAPTIEPGTQDVTDSVTVVYELR
jgi:uncharacterized protein YggE